MIILCYKFDKKNKISKLLQLTEYWAHNQYIIILKYILPLKGIFFFKL